MVSFLNAGALVPRDGLEARLGVVDDERDSGVAVNLDIVIFFIVAVTPSGAAKGQEHGEANRVLGHLDLASAEHRVVHVESSGDVGFEVEDLGENVNGSKCIPHVHKY